MNKVLFSTSAAAVLLLCSGCVDEGVGPSPEPSPAVDVETDAGLNDAERPAGWTDGTHSNDVDPNYEHVFDDDVVRRLDITMDASVYENMLADLGGRVSTPGGGPGGGGPGGGGPGGGGPGGPPGGGGAPGAGGGAPDLVDGDPVWVPVTVAQDDVEWTHVGMRFKGNSSLSSSYSEGNRKLPFRLTFDKFEDEAPETDNQRFYGFKKLIFSSNWSDDSFIREALFAELMRSEGIPSARWSFVRVYVDTGDGPQYWGLYTMLEDVSEDAMLNSQLGGEGANVYKPEGTGADWTTFSEEGFEKKTNEDDADYTDVIAAIDALHADHADEEAWRSSLEDALDVDGFLHWLAVNTVAVNWDTYGSMAHNYYLVGRLDDDGRLAWVPWDANMSLAQGLQTRPSDAVADIFHTEVTDNWPLIRKLLDDDVYLATYAAYVESFAETTFASAAVEARATAMHDLIAPFVVGEQGEEAGSTTLSSETAFERSVENIMEHVGSRHDKVDAALTP